MKVHMDAEACTGHGVCEGIRPDIFQVDEHGIAQLVTAYLTEADRTDLEDAVYQCPVQALRLEG